MIYVLEHNNRPVSTSELQSWLWDCFITETCSVEDIGFDENDELDEVTLEGKLKQYIAQLSNDKMVTILKNIGYLEEKKNEKLCS